MISSNALSMFVIVGLILAVYKLMLKNMDLTEQLQAAQLRPGVAGPAMPETEPEPRGKRRERRHARPKKGKRTRRAGGQPQRAAAWRRAGARYPGTVRFSGEVENTGNAPLEALLLEVRLLDGHGRQVGTGEVLLAGGGACARGAPGILRRVEGRPAGGQLRGEGAPPAAAGGGVRRGGVRAAGRRAKTR